MNFDKANSKLLVEIKKLHVPDDPYLPGPMPDVPGTIHDLDLVNGGEVAPENTGTPDNGGEAADDVGAGFDLC